MVFDGRLISGAGVLAAVVQGGSFANAADALGLSASGVSRAIARLEGRVGVRSLDRTTRSVHLTDEGRAFTRACSHTSTASKKPRYLSPARPRLSEAGWALMSIRSSRVWYSRHIWPNSAPGTLSSSLNFSPAMKWVICLPTEWTSPSASGRSRVFAGNTLAPGNAYSNGSPADLSQTT